MTALPPLGRGAETRSRLLGAARELIIEVGWGAVSTRMVASRAGVPTGSVHYHFASVDGLLRATSTQALSAVTAEARAGLAADGVDEGVQRLAELVSLTAADDGSRVLLGEIFLQATRDDAIRSDVALLLAELRDDVVRWLVRQGRTEDARATATVLVAALDALGMHRSLDPGMSLDGITAVLRRIARGAPE